jgi:hypothetical protein
MSCVNACEDKQYCFMLKPYYTCGHVMCFNTGININWCIQCGCKTKNNVSFCDAFNELLTDDEQQCITTTDK